MIEDKDIKSRLSYTLKKPHTHNGIDYTQADVDEGVEVELDEATAKTLLEQGIIEGGQVPEPDDFEKPESD